MKTITTTIKREFLAAIVAKTKTSEYREAKPYWRDRLENIETPFQLRMINGMSKTAPEVTVLVDRVYEWYTLNEYELRIAKVLDVKNWS
jgi:hypothetical protein